MTINRSELFKTAWAICRERGISFGDALRAAWKKAKIAAENERRVREAQQAAGITEQCHSWYGWRSLGREVRHGEKTCLQVEIVDPDRKAGVRVKSYFVESQTEPIAA